MVLSWNRRAFLQLFTPGGALLVLVKGGYPSGKAYNAGVVAAYTTLASCAAVFAGAATMMKIMM
eukprot:6280186-Prorocentrum_lima.AAC.1